MARQLTLNKAKNQLLDTARHLELLVEEKERKAQQAASHSGLKPEA
jgi:hypothetical protein